MKRSITELIKEELEHPNRKVVLLLGQRRVGKTYVLKRLMDEYENAKYYDFEDKKNQSLFIPSVSDLEQILGNKEITGLVLFDEIQYLEKSGSILKLLYDHFPNLKIVATGSASFLMMKNIGDSLYGRYFSFYLYPLTMREIIGETDLRKHSIGGFTQKNHKPKIDASLENRLIYGSLPEVFEVTEPSRKKDVLSNYIGNLLFKDIFEIERIQHPRIFMHLLHLLAFHIGRLINPNELSNTLGIDRKTVLEYIYLYEKFHLIKTYYPFYKNPNKEIKKSFKIYFTDLGIRNGVIEDFKLLQYRNDTGALFENFAINMFQSNIHYFKSPYKMYFWRNYKQAEVDLVLENSETGKLNPIEIKWTKNKKPSRAFRNQYESKIEQEYCVNKENLWRYI